MASFYAYDLLFFGIFLVALFAFFYKKRKNFSIDGPLYLYRTSFGLKVIDWFGKKHANWLRPLQYVVVTSGYILMVSMVYMLVKVSYYYLTVKGLAETIKVPIVFPLIPYLPEVFNIDFLPPLYFTYWIVILAIVAIPHEFAHGIFAKLNKVRIKSTGFGFLRIFKLPTPFLAAFVEQDDKQMNKASKFGQLAILAAGTFANVLFVIIFGLVFWLFFSTAYTPNGVIFNDYASAVVNVSDISEVNGVKISSFDYKTLNDVESRLVTFKTKNGDLYYSNPSGLYRVFDGNYTKLTAYVESPALEANLSGAILEMNGFKVESKEQISNYIQIRKPGDEMNIKTILPNGEIKEYDIELSSNNGKPFLGIGFAKRNHEGVMGLFYKTLDNIKDPNVNYESRLGDFGWFIYYLLWWLVVICIGVALTNMLPLGIFDGGRFFMITIWMITGSQKVAIKSFQWVTYIFLALLVVLMLKWVMIFF